MPVNGAMTTGLWEKESFVKETIWELYRMKFFVKVQWICFFFQVPDRKSVV